jgi:hypothetical protein
VPDDSLLEYKAETCNKILKIKLYNKIVVIYDHLAYLLRWKYNEMLHFKVINSKPRNCLQHRKMSFSKYYLLLGRSKFYHLHKTSPFDVVSGNIRKHSSSVVTVQISFYLVSARSCKTVFKGSRN